MERKSKVSVKIIDFVMYLNHVNTREAVPLVPEGQTLDTIGAYLSLCAT